MNWNSKDIELYLKEKDYIDTAVIPLLPISLGDQMRQAAEQGEFIQLLSLHLERQFKGRMLFLPPFSYVEDLHAEQPEKLLMHWENSIKQSGIQFVFYLTSDKRWKEHQFEMEGSLFYIPSVPLKDMDESIKHSVMEDQMKQLMPKIIRSWQETN